MKPARFLAIVLIVSGISAPSLAAITPISSKHFFAGQPYVWVVGCSGINTAEEKNKLDFKGSKSIL